jgi:hypothetical protein
MYPRQDTTNIHIFVIFQRSANFMGHRLVHLRLGGSPTPLQTPGLMQRPRSPHTLSFEAHYQPCLFCGNRAQVHRAAA